MQFITFSDVILENFYVIWALLQKKLWFTDFVILFLCKTKQLQNLETNFKNKK